ncbi:DUF6714 family protein [Ideonella azotifigens]|uniref:DUF6714 family protein n=2 Tax=Ideonella azotifigens TaxID=513160 RepID=UPI0011432599|nr:DUF6714 family protein [Ideonella azotifigens]
MPDPIEGILHDPKCPECSELVNDLQSTPCCVGGELIRKLYQELSHLSATGWMWILPIYLRYCLSDEAIYNRFETEFLIFNLSPNEIFKGDVRGRLAFITDDQLQVLIDLLIWLHSDEYWEDRWGGRIMAGVDFLTKLKADRLA